MPRGFTCADAARHSSSDKFEKLTKKEAQALAKDGRIMPLGESGRVWQYVEGLPARPSEVTGHGRLSMEIDWQALRDFLRVEMSGRPSWCVQERV